MVNDENNDMIQDKNTLNNSENDAQQDIRSSENEEFTCKGSSCGCCSSNEEKNETDAAESCCDSASSSSSCCCEQEQNEDDDACGSHCSCDSDSSSDIVKEDAAPCCSSEEKKPARVQIQVTQEMLDLSSKTLATMLDYLGLDATVKTEGRNSKINLLVASEDAGRIIGRKGQSLESLQLLLNRMMQKNNPDFPKVYIDIDGYSSKRPDGRGKRGERADRSERGERSDRGDRRNDRRGGKRSERGTSFDSAEESGAENDSRDDSFDPHERVLRQQALDAAKEVRRWGENVTLPSMNAHDRRIVHITLEGEADLHTESMGDGNLKSVVVSLKK